MNLYKLYIQCKNIYIEYFLYIFQISDLPYSKLRKNTIQKTILQETDLKNVIEAIQNESSIDTQKLILSQQLEHNQEFRYFVEEMLRTVENTL